MGDTENVRVGSPKAGGYAFTAPMTATPPTSASSTLTGYEDLGYLAEEWTLNPNVETEDKKDWKGDVVRTVLTDAGAEATITLIECNEVTLAEVFGEDNVTVDGVTGAVHVSFDGSILPHKRYSFELYDKPKVGRIVINDGQVITPGGGERTFNRAELRQFEVTIKCFRDASGKFFHEYEEDEDETP